MPCSPGSSGPAILAGNPLALSRQRARRAAPRVTRFLGARSLAGGQGLHRQPAARDGPRARTLPARAVAVLPCSTWAACELRKSAPTRWGDFFCRRDADGHERWWLEITGKGEKERLVPASAEMMVEVGRYRRERGLSVLPVPREVTPLVLPLGKSMKPLTRAALHTIIKNVFAGARRKVATARRGLRCARGTA